MDKEEAALNVEEFSFEQCLAFLMMSIAIMSSSDQLNFNYILDQCNAVNNHIKINLGKEKINLNLLRQEMLDTVKKTNEEQQKKDKKPVKKKAKKKEESVDDENV